MERVLPIDSIVLQVKGDDLKIAEKIASVLDGKLQVLINFPIRSTKEGRKEYREITGRAIPKKIAFVALIYHSRGQAIQLQRYGNGKGLEIHFHGLHQYDANHLSLNDEAIQRRAIFDEFVTVWSEPIRLVRIDYCFDIHGMKRSDYTNSRLHRMLSKKHGKPEIGKNLTIYYQPNKPKYTKLLAYDKQKSSHLDYHLIRVEFRFLGQYWRKMEVINASDLLAYASSKTDTFLKRFVK